MDPDAGKSSKRESLKPRSLPIIIFLPILTFMPYRNKPSLEGEGSGKKKPDGADIERTVQC